MKHTRHILQIIALAVALLAAGQSAWATTKTVTYRITDWNLNSNKTAYEIVFTRSGDTPFDTSAPTTYTASVLKNSISSPGSSSPDGSSGVFTVELADGFQLSLSWHSGSNVRFLNNCIGVEADNRYITYTVSCPNTNYYYVTHVMLTGMNSNYQRGLSQPYPHYNEPIDYGYDGVWGFSQSYQSRYDFGQITVTYTDVPPEYSITYVDAVHRENGVTNNNPTSYNVHTPDFQITAPTRTGYTFDGFYRDEQHTQAVTLPETVTQGSAATDKARTYYATWTPITYQVAFQPNGGTGTMGRQTFTYDVAQNLTANAFTRTGYDFTGWNTRYLGSGDSYTDGQIVSNLANRQDVIVYLYAQWATDYSLWGTGNDGSAEYPYVITSTEGLDLLAFYVNDGISFSGKYFLLGNDITYTYGSSTDENNFTAIGKSNNYSFSGIFDGQGHTINGIRISKSGSDNQGLFGFLNGGTVKNVVLIDARITGNNRVGGIAGMASNGAIQDCFVLNTHIEAANDSDKGVIAGYSSNGSICARNFYLSSSVNGRTGGVGANNYDRNWACGLFTVALPVGVSVISGGSLTYDDITYYSSYQNTVTLSYANPPSGKVPMFTVSRTDDGSVVAETTGTFTMPAADVSVSVDILDGFTLDLPDGVTATGSIVTLGNIDYFLEGATVSLSYPGQADGYDFYYSVNGSPIEGNTFTITANSTVTVTTHDLWGIADGADGSTAEKAFVITTTQGLDLLARKVNGTDGYSKNDYLDKFFRLGNDISYSHTTAWDDATSTENNYTPIGYYGVFKGTFDGDGHSVGGIRIYKGGSSSDDNNQGLFGNVGNSGIIKNLTVTDARITGRYYVGGIAGYVLGDGVSTIENCHASATVAIHAVVGGAEDHGGIVGDSGAEILGCTSAASLTLANGLTECDHYGGIVGYNGYKAKIKNCLVIGANVNGSSYVGAIVGQKNSEKNNYYSGCSVNGSSINVGSGSGDLISSDGAMPAVASASKPEAIGEQTAVYPHGGLTAYEHGICYNGVYYLRLDLSDTAVVDLHLVQGTKDGVTAWWGTFFNSTYNFTLDEGAMAYTMDDSYNLYRLGTDGRTIPKNTAVVIIATNATPLVPAGAPATATIQLHYAGSEYLGITDHAPGGNILQGSDSAVPVTSLPTWGSPFVLSVDANGAIGFRQYTGTDAIPAHKAYYMKTP